MKKRSFIFFFALMAVTSLLNFAIVEPAFACNDNVTHSDEHRTETEPDNCFTHCSIQHQWVLSDLLSMMQDNFSSRDFVPVHSSFYQDSPAGSIFHPPLTV